MRSILLFFFFVFSAIQASSQVTDAFKELRIFSKKKEVLPTDTGTYLDYYYQQGIHYLYPLYKAFYREETLLKADTTLYYDMLTQAVSFTGDYASVIALERNSHEPLDDSARYDIRVLAATAKEVEYTDARKYIISQAANNRVVMINEAHDKPLHRAFTASLLEDLYKQGFRYLAMEMLNNYFPEPVLPVSIGTGYYAVEPVAGELIRKAKQIGYTLISYEDTVSTHTTGKEREYAQAQNLFNAIKKLGQGAKVLVQASYQHVQEASKPDAPIAIPMAAYFKLISGIDPLTIDQTEMTEGGTNAFTSALYDSWYFNKPFNTAVVAMKDGKALDPFALNFYDIHVMHPPVRFSNGRAAFTSMDGWKKETAVNPAYQSLFMVQAYYAGEYNEQKLNQAVPADQTYIASQNGVYYVYLHSGKYKIVFRDKEYKILGVKDIEVN